MNRAVARSIHEQVNITYWAEHINLKTGNGFFDVMCAAARRSSFSFHELQKATLFDTRKVRAINGETVVAGNGDDFVDKFMFRYPGQMPLPEFFLKVQREIGTLTSYLAGIALPTDVTIKTARIFRLPFLEVDAVAQTQQRLNLDRHMPLDSNLLAEGRHSSRMDRTALGLEQLLSGTHAMAAEEGFYPDLGPHSGNIRRDDQTGTIKLTDVMPVYEDGNRLIDDGADILPSTLLQITAYEEFVGRYGS